MKRAMVDDEALGHPLPLSSSSNLTVIVVFILLGQSAILLLILLLLGSLAEEIGLDFCF
jgi:hypothetical protein